MQNSSDNLSCYSPSILAANWTNLNTQHWTKYSWTCWDKKTVWLAANSTYAGCKPQHTQCLYISNASEYWVWSYTIYRQVHKTGQYQSKCCHESLACNLAKCWLIFTNSFNVRLRCKFVKRSSLKLKHYFLTVTSMFLTPNGQCTAVYCTTAYNHNLNSSFCQSLCNCSNNRLHL